MKNYIGDIIKNDSNRIKTARVHQGWWRSFVLNKPQGARPNNPKEKVCNSIDCSNNYYGNFLSDEIASVVKEVLLSRENDAPGSVQESRLKGNLLSSQPLCFNFFGPLYRDNELALKIIKEIYPEITSVGKVLFEYAPTPKSRFTNDNSAFDVAIEVSSKNKKGLIGIECKYTESFSPKVYDTERYQEIYSNSDAFKAKYSELTCSKYNQIFRGQLIAESLVQNSSYDFVNTMIFCAPEDKNAKKIGLEFSELIDSSVRNFKTVDYFEFIEIFQRQVLTQEQRELSMLLWARYMAYDLSKEALNAYNKG